MSTTTAAPAATKVTTGLGRFSYAHFFEPRAMEEGQDKKYGVSFLIPKTDKPGIKKIEAAIEACKKIALEKLGGKLPKNFKMPLRDGDEEKEDDPNYAGHYFINCSSKQKPNVVDKDMNAILDATEVKSGDYGRLSLNFFFYDKAGSKGISAGLNNVQKLKNGEALGSSNNVEEDFAEAIIVDEEDDLL
jgi:hypothetical protein